MAQLNPFYGVLINGIYYAYEAASYTVTYPVRNTTEDAQNSRVLKSALGVFLPTHTVNILLENRYFTYDSTTGNKSTGQTMNSGYSRLIELKTMLGLLGNSAAVTFVAPDGSTHLTVATGAIDAKIFNPDGIGDSGIEYAVSLTLVNIQ